MRHLLVSQPRYGLLNKLDSCMTKVKVHGLLKLPLFDHKWLLSNQANGGIHKMLHNIFWAKNKTSKMKKKKKNMHGKNGFVFKLNKNKNKNKTFVIKFHSCKVLSTLIWCFCDNRKLTKLFI